MSLVLRPSRCFAKPSLGLPRRLAGRVSCEERVREIPLGAHDVAPVPLELEFVSPLVQPLPFT
jgi:hypothetical protein